MRSIDVEDLPEPYVEAVKAVVESFRRQLGEKREPPTSPPVELPRRRLGVIGDPAREMSDFDALLRSISKRPAMYVGKCSIRAISAYLDGYNHALGDVGRDEPPLSGWGCWVESRFLISHPAWHWTRILLHVHGDDRAAIEALPELHREFLARRADIGVEGIEEERGRRIFAEYGREWGEPSETSTTCEM